MGTIFKIAEGCIEEAADDYVGLWQIATRVRRAFGSETDDEIKQHSLEVVRYLIEGGLYPGDYLQTGFKFWNETGVKQMIERIEREWDVERGGPTLANPICCFASK